MAKPYFNNAGAGSVLIMSAILLPLAMLLAGMVIDIGRAFSFKAEISRACMVSAEEAAKEISMDIAQEHGSSFLNDDFEDVINRFFYENISLKEHFEIENLGFEVIDSMSNPKYIKVYCQANIDCFFLKLIGIADIKIHSNGCGRLKKI